MRDGTLADLDTNTAEQRMQPHDIAGLTDPYAAGNHQLVETEPGPQMVGALTHCHVGQRSL
jgi:hypothetical protein